MVDSSCPTCPTCALFGQPEAIHPRLSIHVDILHRALAGERPVDIAAAIDRDPYFVGGVLKDLRAKGTLPGGVGKRGRPRRVA